MELVGGIPLSAEQIKYCYRKEASFFVSRQCSSFSYDVRCPFIHPFVHSFKHKHILNIYRAPGPVLSQRHGNESGITCFQGACSPLGAVSICSALMEVERLESESLCRALETMVRSLSGGQEGSTMLMPFKMHLERLQMAENGGGGDLPTKGTSEQRHEAW